MSIAAGALVVAALPAVTVAEAQATGGDDSGVVFYTPSDGGMVPPAGSKVHVVLGADPGVSAVQLSYRTSVNGPLVAIGRPQRTPGTNMFEAWWTVPATASNLLLEATGYTADNTAFGGAEVETVTPSSAASRFTDPGAGDPNADPRVLGPFVRPRRLLDAARPDRNGAVVPLGMFQRVDGRSFARASGKISSPSVADADQITAVDATPGTVVPPTPTLPLPAGTYDADSQIFREPVDVSTHAIATPLGSTVILVSNGPSSDALEAPLYLQTVTAVRSQTSTVPGTDNVTIQATVTDQYNQPVVGAPVRLAGYASGSATPVSQLAITDGGGQATFTGPGTSATGYPTGFYTAYADLNVDGRRGSKEPGYESVVGTVSYVAPGKSLYHSDARIRDAGGVLADSLRGTRIAAARHYQWIDQDGQLSYTSYTGLRGGVGRVSQPGHLTWVNAHGAPFNPRWLKKGRFETRVWARIKSRPGLRNAEMTFKQNAAYGLSVEWEVKNIKPFTTTAALDAAFTNLATAAQQYYGSAWASRVQVKMLSNLPGGPAFALRVLKVARAHGFTTIYLARGAATRMQIPASAHSYVTYVRGAAAGVFAPIPPASQFTRIIPRDPAVLSVR